MPDGGCDIVDKHDGERSYQYYCEGKEPELVIYGHHFWTYVHVSKPTMAEVQIYKGIT